MIAFLEFAAGCRAARPIWAALFVAALWGVAPRAGAAAIAPGGLPPAPLVQAAPDTAPQGPGLGEIPAPAPGQPQPARPVRPARRGPYPIVTPPPPAAPSEPHQVTASPEGFAIAQLKYGGGGDWYADETSIENLLAALKERTTVKVARSERVVVSAGDEQLFNYPFLYIVGHGNIKFTPLEVERLRAYLQGGGFLWANDDYGMDPSFRREIKRVLPGDSLVELPFDHEIYRSFYKIQGGLPKIHEHDGGPARALAVYHGGRMVVFYDFDSDIGDGIEDNEMHHDPPEKREAAMQMAINIVMYALTH